MRTLLSQLDTARKSVVWFWAGEKARSEMVSVGGSLKAMSPLRSPVVCALEEEAAAALPKSPDMVSEASSAVVAGRQWSSKENDEAGQKPGGQTSAAPWRDFIAL